VALRRGERYDKSMGDLDRLAPQGGKERMSKRTHLIGTISHRTLTRFGAKEPERS